MAPADDPATRRICPDDSIRATIGGYFPNGCFRLRRVDVQPQWHGPLPQPPVLRLVFDNLCCATVLCAPGSFPWQASVTLPPLPTRDYSLVVQAVEVCCTDSIRPGDPTGTRIAPFQVLPPESCGAVTQQCLIPVWDHSGRVGACDSYLAGGEAQVTLMLRTTVPLAGF